MPYAAGTTVRAEDSEREIRRLLERAGAESFAVGYNPERASLQFRLRGRFYRITIERPKADEIKAAYIEEAMKQGRQYEWTIKARADRIDFSKRTGDEWNRRWRARLMWLKAQIEFSEDAPLEEAMLHYLVLPDGKTMGQWATPQIDVYEAGKMPPMLGDGR